MAKQTFKVLVVDDSALVRKILSEILDADPELEVVGTAQDPFFARDKIKKLNPDVITLDIEMPRMDGITFLEKLMRSRPMPVVIVSSLAEANADVTLQALELGAITCIEKPKVDLTTSLKEQGQELVDSVKAAATSRELIDTIKVAAQSKVQPRFRKPPPDVDLGHTPGKKSHHKSGKLTAEDLVKHKTDAVLPARKIRAMETSERIVAIGASTGGTVVVQDVLEEMPVDCPGIVIVQHMPGGFTANLAARLNSMCTIEVREAKDGDRILPGIALLAPAGTHHTVVKRSGSNYHVQLLEGPRVERHIPSVNVLFRSVAQEAGPNSVGVILTGMGDDGAEGMFEMHQAGAVTIAQNKASCVVFGMPKEAINRGGVDHVVTRKDLTKNILKYAKSKIRV